MATNCGIDVILDAKKIKNTDEADEVINLLLDRLCKALNGTNPAYFYDTYATVNGESIKRMELDEDFNIEGSFAHADSVDIVASFTIEGMAEPSEDDCEALGARVGEIWEQFENCLYVPHFYVDGELVDEW